ncbi:MAG: ABC transporter substrate-binding protein [Acetobacterales bacterium]
MPDPVVTVACWNYDRAAALLDGRVPVAGFRVAPVVLKSEQLFPRAFARAEFDVSELSLSSYLLQLSRGESEYVAIPVFISRAFRHGSVYIRTDRGIEVARDLEGRAVGVPEYQMTLALWARGILQDEYETDFRRIRWRTAGTNEPGRKERLPLRLPPEMEVRPLPEGQTLNQRLLDGELDAIVSPTPPDCFVAGNPVVRRLFPDPGAEERAYFRRTGFFPIMHLIGIRRPLVEAFPELPASLFRAFVAAKRVAVEEWDVVVRASANKTMLPWVADAYAEARGLMGENWWPYGVPANRAELEAICRYSHEQSLSDRLMEVHELFAPGTEALTDA